MLDGGSNILEFSQAQKVLVKLKLLAKTIILTIRTIIIIQFMRQSHGKLNISREAVVDIWMTLYTYHYIRASLMLQTYGKCR